MPYNSPREVINAVKNHFSLLELGQLYLNAGASMVLHGLKKKTSDLDIFIPDAAHFMIAARLRDAEIQTSPYTGHLYFKIGKDIEVFTRSPVDPTGQYGVTEGLENTSGVRHTTVDQLTRWYEYAIEHFGRRQKDIDSLGMIQLRNKVREAVSREQHAE